MLTLRAVLTHLCQNLLDEPHDTPLSHLTLNLPLQAISGYYRVPCDGAVSITTFSITPQCCIGSLLQEPDGAYWAAPYLMSWAKLEEYPIDVPPTQPLSWRTLLGLFATIEIIEVDPVTQYPRPIFMTATELAEFSQLEECSGSIKPDTNLGGNLATLKEVFNGKTTSFIFNRVQAGGFILAVLVAEGVLERVPKKARHYRYPTSKADSANRSSSPAVTPSKPSAIPAKKPTKTRNK